MTIRSGSETLADFSRKSTNRTWDDLVERAERISLSKLDSPLHISALCDLLDVSERTLRKAFHSVHGVPPCRHLRMRRLSNARQALLSSDPDHTTVTEVATRCGFAELGRFSVEYRSAFGESPSATLQRMPQAVAGEFSGTPRLRQGQQHLNAPSAPLALSALAT